MIRGAAGDCVNMRRTRFEVFSLDENVITPGARQQIIRRRKHTMWKARTGDANVQVREVV